MKKICCIGDSTTAGNNPNGGYRRHLAKRIAQTNKFVEFVGTIDGTHEGHNGWFTFDLINNIQNILSINNPDIVILLIGTNDIVAPTTGPTIVNAAPANLAILLQMIPADLTSIIGTIVSHSNPYAQGYINDYNFKLEDCVMSLRNQGHKKYLADTASGVPPVLLADGVHPNDIGYSNMANIFYSTLRCLL